VLWIVLPVRNESAIIAWTLKTLRAFLVAEIHEPWRVIVADNASTDATRDVVREVAAHDVRIALLAFDRPGKGLAIRAGWEHALARNTDATPVFLFMDADLATDLRHIPELIAAIRGGVDVAIGSRFAHGAHVERSVARRIVSRANQLLLRLVFGLRVADAPCGFKAVHTRVVRELLPLVHDDRWFFDTELLIRSQRAGYRIVEIPVTWHEPRSGTGSLRKVLRITRTNLHAIRALARDR